MIYKLHTILLGFFVCLASCNNNDESVSSDLVNRNFKMGFTTWSFGPTEQDVEDTYLFIENNSDIYAEHIDNKIPWNAWINNLILPTEFTNEINGRVNRKIHTKQFLLSVSLLNSNRDELALDFDGTIPSYTNLNDIEIEDAYFRHIRYLVNQFSPDYLVIAIEVNELRLRNESKWNAYKLLIQNVKSRIKQLYPNLSISESISLHNLYEPNIDNPTEYIDEVINHMNQMDFVSISFYPFIKNQHSRNEFQQTLDFLHNRITKPIAFVESSHLAENLLVPNLNISINGNETEQNNYLETLLTNAQQQDYEFIIWWAHRDYDALWETFPIELMDIGKLWRDTGLLDEEGNERLSFTTWKTIFEH
ncbi:glycosyl hydrolase 53 family protein [uncultured Psychroserpens sp.]|uniref:glycosyl hydrolase 53 family protein n=1 Tax=uncultured Psychroserpens sp. TaxID=255436 RepID=UPI00262AF3BB|nr:glycosyl hydrolase 53 family protein [uncultured Psychroserpens sp.]